MVPWSELAALGRPWSRAQLMESILFFSVRPGSAWKANLLPTPRRNRRRHVELGNLVDRLLRLPPLCLSLSRSLPVWMARDAAPQLTPPKPLYLSRIEPMTIIKHQIEHFREHQDSI